MNTHVVTKSFSGPEGVVSPGTEVDASDWRHARQLEEQRFIKPIQPNEREERMGRKDKSDGHTRQQRSV